MGETLARTEDAAKGERTTTSDEELAKRLRGINLHNDAHLRDAYHEREIIEEAAARLEALGEGVVVVPVAPTEEIQIAMVRAWNSHGRLTQREFVRAMYRAALAARPKS